MLLVYFLQKLTILVLYVNIRSGNNLMPTSGVPFLIPGAKSFVAVTYMWSGREGAVVIIRL